MCEGSVCAVLSLFCYSVFLFCNHVSWLLYFVICGSFLWCHGLVYSVIVVFLDHTQLLFLAAVLSKAVSLLLLIHCCLGFVSGPAITTK